MSFVRPAISEAVREYREVILGLALALLGVWVASGGGYFLLPLGLVLLVLGAGLAMVGWRRLRFRQAGEAPGTVQVTEGEIAYFGPQTGGFIALPDLAEIRLLTLRGRHIWRLKAADGQTLHIPVQALGAGALFDAFATLPGLDTGALVAALGSKAPSESRVIALAQVDQLIWTRKGAGMVVR